MLLCRVLLRAIGQSADHAPDLVDGVPSGEPHRYDLMLSNPPFHAGKAAFNGVLSAVAIWLFDSV